MARSVAEILSRLEPDVLRGPSTFSPEISEATAKILALGDSEDENREEEIQNILNDWLAKNQPCLFGRLAAKKGLLSYCILTERDLEKNDAAIQEKIQKAR